MTYYDNYHWNKITRQFEIKKMRKPNIKRIKNQIWRKYSNQMHPIDWQEFISQRYEHINCLVIAYNQDDEAMYWQAVGWLYDYGIRGIA